ncbi:hypothetical protein PDJ82_08300 [Bacillus cereus group sp. TH43LC]|uniref:hypothetical protein n=1 Tax=unclassified Bacillus cereus group TaxID=2750818 RepID=UPI000A610FD0|nr:MULTISPECIES: hypothetical protein [unclassified Bacillus cereus group]MDA1501595.1 hypothetical protein [Bacillus cereus group sp. TH43LC]MDA2237198.1 hypothetical protein [Bacillus cereus group sp. Bc222]
MNKNGIKGILDDANKEKELRSLIVRFDEKHNLKSKVTYKDIFEFVKKTYEQGGIEFFPGYTWWKTKGKHLVDEYNIVRKKSIRLSEKEELEVVDIVDLVEKHYGDKNTLIKGLLPYSHLVDRLVEKIEALQSNLANISKQLNKKSDIIKDLENENEKLSTLLDGFFYMLLGSEKELKKVINTGETKCEEINYALTETFGNPIMYIEKLSQNIDMSNPKEDRDNIIQLKSKNSVNIQKDDYDW